jgi:hypothetical protein
MTKQFNRSLSVDLDIAVRDVFISALKFSHFVLIKKEYRLFPGNINHFWLVIYSYVHNPSPLPNTLLRTEVDKRPNNKRRGIQV